MIPTCYDYTLSLATMYYENSFSRDFSRALDTVKSDKIIGPNVLKRTKEYYEKECQAALKDTSQRDFVEPYKEITAFTLDNVLSVVECKKLIATAEDQGFKDLQSYRKGYRDNQRVVLHDPKSAKILLERVRAFLPPEIVILNTSRSERWVLDAINPMFRFGKYNPDDAFAAHKDAGYSPSQDRRSMLTIMWYLSDVEPVSGSEMGGRTRMLTLNKTCRKSEDSACEVLDAVVPTPGRCVIFNQYCIYHDGESVKKCKNPKYIMRTDIMYKRA